MLRLAADAGISAGDDAVNRVASYIMNSAEYDLNVSGFDTDDYAVYFLTEAKRGYCTHFATAAAVMYRALGIPARVVDGFAFTTVAGSYVDVRRSDEHAWVEVYIDGLGWLPVEVTAAPRRAKRPSTLRSRSRKPPRAPRRRLLRPLSRVLSCGRTQCLSASSRPT